MQPPSLLKKLSKTSLLVAATYLLLSIYASFFAAWDMQQRNERRVQQTLNEVANRVADDVGRRLYHYQYGLRGARGAVLTSGDALDRRAYHTYAVSRDVSSEFPGAQGFGFIRRVPLAQEMAFLERVRQNDFPDFQLKQKRPHNHERFVVQYFEPLASNEYVLGVDVASYPDYRSMAISALRDGRILLSPPYPSKEKPDSYAYDILLAVYPQGDMPSATSDRERQGLGWVFAKLDISQAVPTISTLQKNHVHLVLKDITDPDGPRTVYRSIKNYQALGLPQVQLEREVYGRLWQFNVIADLGIIDLLNLTSPGQVLWTGLLTSLLIFLVLLGFGYSRYLRKTSEAQRNYTSAIISSSPDAIITCDRNGMITTWNQGAESLFRYRADEALGAPLLDTIVPPDLYEEEKNIRYRLLAGEHVPNFNTRRKRKHGSPVDVSVAVAPIVEKGQVVGYSKTLRDISDEVMAQRQIVELNKNLEALVSQRTCEVEETRQTLQNILDNIPLRVAYWDTDKRLIMANQENLRSLQNNLPGITLRQAVGKSLEELMTDRGYEVASRLLDESIKTGKKYSEEINLHLPEGDELDLLVHVIPAVTAGRIVGYYTVSHNVTELRKNRREIAALTRENQLLLQTINEQLVYIVTALDGTILEVNDHCCRVMGYEREEMLEQSADILISGVDEAQQAYKNVTAAVLAGNTWRGELPNRCKDGSIRWFDTFVVPSRNSEDKIDRYVALRIDITERRHAQQEIKRVNAFLNGVLEAASEVAIIGGDTNGIITLFNSGAENMLGYSAEEMVGKQTPSVFHDPEEVTQRAAQLSEYFGSEVTGFEVFVLLPRVKGAEVRQWTYVRKDGSKIRVSLAVTAMRDDDGAIAGYLGVAVDITAEEQYQKNLEAVRDQLTIAAEVAQLGVWSWNLLDNSVKLNARMCEIYDLPLELQEEGFSYSQWLLRVHPEDRSMVEASLKEALASTGVYEMLFRIQLPSDEVRSIQAAGQIARDIHGEAINVTGINRDITQQLALQDDLRQAKHDADVSNAAKSAFLANMSHEIRTPINAVLGMLRLARNTALNPRQRDYIVKADTAARTLLDLLNDILDFSKIEAGGLELEVSPMDLEQILRDLGVVLDGYHTNKAVELSFYVDPRIPRIVRGDSLRFKQILINLASNALKFTEQGSVLVRLDLQDLESSELTLRVAVIDTGIGIDEHLQGQIFEYFTQAEASTARRFGGPGLGLVICKRLVELMGGELHLQSQPGKGSHFWFDIKLAVEEIVDIPQVSDDIRVLLVEDNPLVADVHERMLTGMGYRVTLAANAGAAIGSVQVAVKQQQPFDLILLDWLLPDMKGDEAAAMIAGSVEPAQMPKIIMLTAHSEAIAESGLPTNIPYCHRLISKPVTARQLYETITAALAGEHLRDSNEEGAAADQRLQNLHLLVVEDNAMNRQVAEELLIAEGAIVDVAEDGREGVAKVLARPARYDVVLMDMQMPVIDGLEATRQIRAQSVCAQLPIIAMTANVAADDRQRCLEAGMNDHVGKPIDMAILVPRILALLKDGRALPEPEAREQSSAEDWKQTVLKRFGGNEKMFLRVQPKFYATINELLQQFQLAVQQQNRQAAQEALHSIKGSAATLGASALAGLAAELEQRLKQLSDDEGVGELGELHISQLRKMLESSAAALQNLAESLASSEDKPAIVESNVSSDVLKKQLTEVLSLLESDNMRAIEVMESLFQAASVAQRQQLHTLVDQVNALQFTEAITTLNRVIQEV